eukprot:1144588-Pelagomonas_calceolata.AAC.2
MPPSMQLKRKVSHASIQGRKGGCHIHQKTGPAVSKLGRGPGNKCSSGCGKLPFVCSRPRMTPRPACPYTSAALAM